MRWKGWVNRDAKCILGSRSYMGGGAKEAPAKAGKKGAAKLMSRRQRCRRLRRPLGDLSALAELKASMEAEEKPAKKATKKAAKKDAE